MFITFAGPEGAGKTTIMAKMFELISASDKDGIIVTHEPGGTPVGDQIRTIALGYEMDPITELLLYNAARRELVERVIFPALMSGKIVLCDRYAHCTVAYQGYGRGVPLELIREANKLATRDLQPNITFLLDIDPEISLARKIIEESNRFEAEDLDFHRRVRQGYLDQAAQNQTWVVIDASQSKEDVFYDVCRGYSEFLANKIEQYIANVPGTFAG